MRTLTVIAILGCLLFASFYGTESGSAEKPIAGKDELPGPIIEKVSFQNVAIKDNFWRPKIELNRMAGIRRALQQCSRSIENFDIAAGKKQGKHELYCAGHLIEAAAAYYEATGKRKLLDAAIRLADHIDSVFGPDKRLEAPGHEEIELALFKLYKVTHDRKYLNLSAFFVDERGDPKRMIVDKITPPDRDPNANTPQRWRPPSYMQDHIPVTKQFYAVGHAVRATYLYTAMADISMETRDSKYLPSLDSIWNDIVGKKLYITGGIGTRQFHDEGFGSAYLLPNDQAYCETCSSIGFTFWNSRMNLL